MKIQVTEAPSGLPITLTDLKAHLRIEDSESEYDADLTQLLNAATEWVFSNCHITLMQTEYECYFDCFTTPMKMPVFPVQSVDSISYTDADGVGQLLASYQSDLLQSPAKIYPAISETFPETQSGKINPVVIAMTAGYASSSDVPHLARHLIRLLVGHWFVNREAVGVGTTKEIEFSANELVKMIRVNEFEVL